MDRTQTVGGLVGLVVAALCFTLGIIAASAAWIMPLAALSTVIYWTMLRWGYWRVLVERGDSLASRVTVVVWTYVFQLILIGAIFGLGWIVGQVAAMGST